MCVSSWNKTVIRCQNENINISTLFTLNIMEL